MVFRLVLVGMVATVASLPARADGVNYDFSATLSGSLDGNRFSSALVRVTGTADSSQVTERYFDVGQYVFVTRTVVLPLDVSIAGLGSTAFSDTMELSTTANAGPDFPLYIEMADLSENNQGLQITPLEFDLPLQFNTLTKAGSYSGYTAATTDPALNTEAGPLLFDSTYSASGMFTVSVVSSVTPEPSSFALLGTALLGVAGIVSRRSNTVG